MDVRLEVLIALGERLGIGQHARVAAAFLSTGMELFVNLTPRMRGASRLLPSQVALGEPGGDIHTAVKWYLTWQSHGETLPDNLGTLIKMGCFKKMAYQLNKDGFSGSADELLRASDWRLPLTVAVAFAHQSNIMHRYGDGYAGRIMETDEVRPLLGLKDVPLKVIVSPRSLCCTENCSGLGPEWIVYAAAGRHPTVKVVTSLPSNVAGWFIHCNFEWDVHPMGSFTVLWPICFLVNVLQKNSKSSLRFFGQTCHLPTLSHPS